MTGKRNRTCGYSLIELLVVITVLASLLGLCVGTLHLLMKLDRAGRDASDEAADLFRLARDFRADVHAATDAEPPSPSAERFSLALGEGRTVDYAIRPGAITRLVRLGDRVVGRESYRRPAKAPASFDVVRHEGSPPIAVLRVVLLPEGMPDGPGREQAIEAEFARDRLRHGWVR